ncbi:TMV resistance protein N-like [Neltuma alba]|uniref:TMV resistance protein N-like n=1 Tax=Neltuma alba TaxID=207710 RepID=UPI0010A4EC7E|nr:TMV resistance protein N-like [Prosopis alba]
MASSSSFFNDSEKKYDVFISFSGKDVRRGFLSHLVKELRREKIMAYVDEKMKSGEQISSSLRGAIQNSQISIVIFSKNYASSSWCLDELEEIMKMKEQIVLPVFYYFDPSNVQNWRSALKNAAELSGYNTSDYRNDSKLIDDIVNGVSSRLNISPSESKGLAGIDQLLDCIRSFLERKSEEVQILGIWGMSGIGKSTIAQVAIDKFSSHFDGSYFLENVREESQKHRLKSLREKLVSELQEEKSSFVHKSLVRRRKVFVVLDDVGFSEQLQYLVTDGIHWGPGSRFIVTSKDKQVLTAGGVHAIHEVKELGPEESLKLFSLNAFKKSHPEKGYEELSKRAVGYAKALPLALKVVGSSLCSKDRRTWESTLRKLEGYPDPQIQDVLKTSYDGLDDVLRDVFLDIAFFYKGEDKDHVIRLLDANNLFAAYRIEGLLDRALISISNDKVIQMHD